MNRLPQQPDNRPIPLFNPSLEAFEFVYDKKTYLLSPYGIESFPKYIADKLARRLADTIISKRGILHNHEQDKNELLKEIYVT